MYDSNVHYNFILEDVSSRSTDLKLGCKLNTRTNQFNHISIFLLISLQEPTSFNRR
jgi:hypothetical protein